MMHNRPVAQATGGCMQLLSIRSCHPNLNRYANAIKKEDKTQFLTYLQKLFPSVDCAYRNPQTKFGADTFILRPFSHSR